MNLANITIVVCTYNRAELLWDCLHSLTQQTVPDSVFQLVVVDNNSSDDTFKVASSFSGKIKNLSIIQERKQGLSYARNAGVAATKTTWISFLDDDAKAAPDWVESILTTIDKDDFDCFGGVYLPWHRFGPKPKWFRSSWETNKAIQPHYGILPASVYPSGGNFSCKVELIKAYGGFSPIFGMNGHRVAYGEETHLFRRMRQDNLRIGFNPDVVIHHCVLPYKYSLTWRVAARFASLRDYFCIIEESFSSLRLAKVLCKSMLRSCKSLFCNFPRTIWGKDYFWQNYLLDAVFPLVDAAAIWEAARKLKKNKVRPKVI